MRRLSLSILTVGAFAAAYLLGRSLVRGVEATPRCRRAPPAAEQRGAEAFEDRAYWARQAMFGGS